MTPELKKTVSHISTFFEILDGVPASGWQVRRVAEYRKTHPELVDDLDFCFEVLAGKHKLGFTLYDPEDSDPTESFMLGRFATITTIRGWYDAVVDMTVDNKSNSNIYLLCSAIPYTYRGFFIKLFNREYRLGYSNRKNMVTNLHCMLAKSYPEGVKVAKEYYIQEKLNGVRCIAYYDFEQEKWRFTSRSQKEKFYPFDMSKLDKQYIYDGEVMSRNAMGNRDFAKTSGLANSKYLDKRDLVYIIYDILDAEMPYKDRLNIMYDLLPVQKMPANILDISRFEMYTNLSDNVAILPPITKIPVKPLINREDSNELLDRILDLIVEEGGEGVMLRDPNAPYHHSSGSGDRKNYLLKYKKLKTCDLRVIGWNEGKGKYEGMIGSFICEDDDHTLKVNVAGIDDDIRASDPDLWIGRIIEVAYFESSRSKTKSLNSLQFPRYRRARPDKTETSLG